jgi:hypothetical protein
MPDHHVRDIHFAGPVLALLVLFLSLHQKVFVYLTPGTESTCSTGSESAKALPSSDKPQTKIDITLVDFSLLYLY